MNLINISKKELIDNKLNNIYYSQDFIECIDDDNILYYCITNENNIKLAFFYVKKYKRKLILSQLSNVEFCQFNNLLIINDKYKEDIFDVIAKNLNLIISNIEMNFPYIYIDLRKFSSNKYNLTLKYSSQILLSLHEEEIFNNYKKALKYNLKRIQKTDIKIIDGNEKYTQQCIEILSKTIFDKAYNFSKMKKLVEKYINHKESIVSIAIINEEVKALSICLIDNYTAVMIFLGRKENNRGISELVIHNNVLKAKALGLKYFDFEGSMDCGVAKFYSKFGGEIKHTFGVKKSSFLFKLLDLFHLRK